MQVAICARVSTKDKGQDAENQLFQLRKFANKDQGVNYKSFTEPSLTHFALLLMHFVMLHSAT
jgi:predicted site-specific integrase-resolvase